MLSGEIFWDDEDSNNTNKGKPFSDNHLKNYDLKNLMNFE